MCKRCMQAAQSLSMLGCWPPLQGQISRRSTTPTVTLLFIDMQGTCVLVAATCPDPKLAKAALSPFHASRDGQTTTSTSGGT